MGKKKDAKKKRIEGPSVAEINQQYREMVLADPETDLADLHDRSIILALDMESVADVLESRPDMARWVARLRTASEGLWVMDR